MLAEIKRLNPTLLYKSPNRMLPLLMLQDLRTKCSRSMHVEAKEKAGMLDVYPLHALGIKRKNLKNMKFIIIYRCIIRLNRL